MTIAIVGAGIAGLSGADRLQAEGHAVIVFDTGRAVGGRMATRHVATALSAVAFDNRRSANAKPGRGGPEAWVIEASAA